MLITLQTNIIHHLHQSSISIDTYLWRSIDRVAAALEMAVQAEKNKSPSGSNNSDNRIESARHQPDSSAVQQTNNGGETVQMKRTLGVWNGIAIIIGVIVGSGIFISPKGVLVRAGSVGASLVVWGLCGLLALLGALCFAELGTSISSSGGEYTYINMAYGPMVSYLYIWVLVVIIMPCSNAISALSFATYCLQPLFEPGYKPPDEAIRLLALAILMLLIYINCVTVDGTLRLQSLFTLAKVLALGAIISYGLYYILAGNNFQSLYGPVVEPELASGNSSVVSVVGNSSRDEADVELEYKGWWFGTETNIFIMARAFYSGFYTYSGW